MGEGSDGRAQLTVRILQGDCREVLRTLPDESVHCCVTSPPYFGLRDYGCEGQMGLEATPEEFVAGMVEVFREVRRVLRDDGTLWLNIGDSYAGSWGAQGREGSMADRSVVQARSIANHPSKATQTGKIRAAGVKPKDLYGIPWMLAFALRADGWYLRQDIIWSKPNPMPESITDRCTKAHEYLFLLSKSARYYYDAAAVAEDAAPESAARYAYSFGGAKNERLTAEEADGVGTRTHPIGDRDFTGKRNRRSVWSIATQPFKEAHFATFPPALVEPCILAGCAPGGTVIDPFGGAGTTGMVADRLQRDAILIELNPTYAEIARKRIIGDSPLFAEVA